MKLDDLELLYLRQVVVARIDSLTHKLDKNLRYYGGSDDDILKERKIGNLEAEIQAMESIKKKVNEEIALIDLLNLLFNYSANSWCCYCYQLFAIKKCFAHSWKSLSLSYHGLDWFSTMRGNNFSLSITLF